MPAWLSAFVGAVVAVLVAVLLAPLVPQPGGQILSILAWIVAGVLIVVGLVYLLRGRGARL
jgi:hypothetical protein